MKRTDSILLAAVTLAVLGVAGMPHVALAATCTWTGSTNTAWETTGNWTNCQGGGTAAPANNDSVIIPDVTNDPVVNTAATTGISITIQSGGLLTNSSSGAIAFTNFTINSGGKYIHDRIAALPGTTRTFAATSTVEFVRNTATVCPVSASYGNLIINVNNFSASIGCAAGLASIAGDLEIKNTNGQQLRFVSTQNTTHSIGGSLIVDGGILVLSSGTGAPAVNVTGSLTMTSGTLDLGNSSGAPALTVSGNFSQSGGTLSRTGTNNRTVNIAGNWTFDGGTFTSTGIQVVFNGSTNQTVGGTSVTPFNDVTVNGGATVTIPDTNIPTAAGTWTNNGKMRQTRTVNNATVNFLQISSTKYQGIDLTTTANLGATLVQVTGNTAVCNMNNGGAYRNRCFFVSTASSGSADVTLHTTAGEDDLSNTDAFFEYIAGTWTNLANCTDGLNAGGTCTATGISFSDHWFLIGDNGNSPTAVTLLRFTAHPAGAPLLPLAAIPLALLFGLAGFGLMWGRAAD